MRYYQTGYTHSEALVSTKWLTERLHHPCIRIIELNKGSLPYNQGHIPGAVKLDWHRDLNAYLTQDYPDNTAFAHLLSSKGISPECTVVFYGDKNNWWTTYACWVFQLFGHTKAKILNGGRMKWIEEGRPMTREIPYYPLVEYPIPPHDDGRIRAFREQVVQHVEYLLMAA